MDVPFQAIRDAVQQMNDEQLGSLTNLINVRREQLSRFKFYSFNVGDRIRFNGTVKPQYLAGCTGVITGRATKKVVVKLDNGPTGRFHGSGIKCPTNILEKIHEDKSEPAVRMLPDGSAVVNVAKMGYSCGACGEHVPAGTRSHYNYIKFDDVVPGQGGLPDVEGIRVAVCPSCWDGKTVE